MYPLILCYCGRDLGSIYDLFKALRAKKFAATIGEENIDPTLLSITDVQVQLDDVLTLLHLHTTCCRVRILTQVEFKEYYS